MRSYLPDLVNAGHNGRYKQRLRGLEPDSTRETQRLIPVATIPLRHYQEAL